MVVGKLREIREKVKFKSSGYPLIYLTELTLPTACKEFSHFLDNQLLDGFVYDPERCIWKRHGRLNFPDSFRLEECLYHQKGGSGERASLTFSIVLPDESDHERYHLVLRKAKLARYQLLEARKSSIDVGGILFEQQRVPGRREYGMQRLVLLKR